jgi:uncharacterized protein DUF4082
MMRTKLFTLMLTLSALLGFSHAGLAQLPLTIFGNGTPQHPIDPDTAAVTLGVKFRSAQPGTIAGIRFYRAARSNSGYVAGLYTTGGTMLGSKTMTSEPCATLPCWEQINFASPISIAANTTYIAAYFVAGGHYAGDTNGLTSAVTSGPLTALSSGSSGGNGVYRYGASIGFPNQTFQASNYWVDIAFTSSAPTLNMSFNPPNPSVASNAAPGSVVATINVTWSDGSPFSGTLSFVAPNGDDNHNFALSGNNIVINPSGPGITSDGGTTQNVTVQAVQ